MPDNPVLSLVSLPAFSLVSLLAFALASLSLSPAASADTRTYKRSVEKYAMPDVTLINQDGSKIRFKNFLSTDKPVVVDFIFGTCTTICPILSAGYASLQQRLGAESGKVHLVSKSIDPENDTPAVLKDYLKRYRSKPGWDFLTGTRKDIDRVGPKMCSQAQRIITISFADRNRNRVWI